MKYRAKRSEKFRSKLEEFCWQELKEHKIEFLYEPLKIPLVSGFEWDVESMEKIGKKYAKQKIKNLPIHYIPDFTDHSDITKISWVIETKGVMTPVAKLKLKLFKLWLKNNNLKWKIYFPSNKKEVIQTVQIIKSCLKVPITTANLSSTITPKEAQSQTTQLILQ